MNKHANFNKQIKACEAAALVDYSLSVTGLSDLALFCVDHSGNGMPLCSFNTNFKGGLMAYQVHQVIVDVVYTMLMHWHFSST